MEKELITKNSGMVGYRKQKQIASYVSIYCLVLYCARNMSEYISRENQRERKTCLNNFLKEELEKNIDDSDSKKNNKQKKHVWKEKFYL
jgi:hypothetical protein